MQINNNLDNITQYSRENDIIDKSTCDRIFVECKELFIDISNHTYREQFILNFRLSIPYSTWIKSDFEVLFNNKTTSLDFTFFLLSRSGKSGFPIGIASFKKKQVILNDGTRISWKQLHQRYRNNKIVCSINLDFGCYEIQNSPTMLCEAAHVDTDVMQNAKFSVNFVGHMVLLDVSSHYYIPIYILNHQLCSTRSHVMQFPELLRLIVNQSNPNDKIDKHLISQNLKYVNIFDTCCKIDEKIKINDCKDSKLYESDYKQGFDWENGAQSLTEQLNNVCDGLRMLFTKNDLDKATSDLDDSARHIDDKNQNSNINADTKSNAMINTINNNSNSTLKNDTVCLTGIICFRCGFKYNDILNDCCKRCRYDLL